VGRLQQRRFSDLLVRTFATFNNYYRMDGNSNAWLTVKPKAGSPTGPRFGAKVRCGRSSARPDRVQMREIFGVAASASQNDLRAAFGLGDATNADIVVLWLQKLYRRSGMFRLDSF